MRLDEDGRIRTSRSRARWPGALALGVALALAAPATPADRRAPPEATSLEAGALLVAHARLSDPHFEHTVVLLLRYGPDGSLGLVINRPTDLDLATVLNDVEGLEAGRLRVHYGGPVGPGRMQLLASEAADREHFTRVLEGVHLFSDRGALARLVRRPASAVKLRAYSGYAGWAPGQLEHEVARGDWYVASTDAATVFSDDSAGLWQELTDWLTQLRAHAEPDPGVAQRRGAPLAWSRGRPVA